MYEIQTHPADANCEWSTEYIRSTESAAIARARKLHREYRGQVCVRVVYDSLEVWST